MRKRNRIGITCRASMYFDEESPSPGHEIYAYSLNRSYMSYMNDTHQHQLVDVNGLEVSVSMN